MRWTEALIPTLREVSKEAEATSHQLLLKGGFIRKLASGIYSYLPLGFRVLQNICEVIRSEMNQAGALELLLPALHPAELWKQSGRYETLGADKIAFRNRSDQEFVLGPTHEEVITELAAAYLNTYQALPKILYQIQTKFRDEIRPRFGIVRTKEFIMKDAYSFDPDQASLDRSYELMYEAYIKIFKRLGLKVDPVAADPGMMGGSGSHEFMVRSPYGEDRIASCNKCKYIASGDLTGKEGDLCPKCGGKLLFDTAMEVGHVFKLGTRYTEPFKASFRTSDGKERLILMGCYGLGINRILAALVEQHHDDKGMKWPVQAAPYQIQLMAVNHNEKETRDAAEKLYSELTRAGFSVLYDDRSERAGVKFNDADLVGNPIQVIVSSRNLAKDLFELKLRDSGKNLQISCGNVLEKIRSLLSLPEVV
ncbi:MAG: proline--tRNA ligase [Candidatus Omnitrophica bacterium]|nr:proline--tRNA ligase [Candidatus Omnitrophota bacterium]